MSSEAIQALSTRQVRQRLRQIYIAYLDLTFHVDCYRELHSRTLKHTQFFDFAIGVGATTSGGSGLGILANPQFAWLCGALTSLSVILSVGKVAYDWPNRIKKSLELAEFYGVYAQHYRHLIDDINYRQNWNDQFNERHIKMRSEIAKAPTYPYRHLSEDEMRKIQKAIKKRINPKEWWRP